MNAQKAIELLLKLAEDETLYNATGLDSPGHRHFEATKTALLARIEAGDRAREALKQLEWIDYAGGGYYCPWCDRWKYAGHAPDCPRQLAIKP